MTNSRSKKRRGGFTLIELLVVVSIISLLSSVILASVRESRGKAQDSKVVSQLLEMRTVAELSNSNGVYGTATGPNDCGTLDTAFTNAKFNDGANWPTIDGYVITPICYSDAASDGDLITAFSVWNNLNNSSGWCVDSEGASIRLDVEPYHYACVGGGGGGGTAQWGDSCNSNSDCQSSFCGYDQNTQQYGVCTDGYQGLLCTSDDQCASNSCDTAVSYTCN